MVERFTWHAIGSAAVVLIHDDSSQCDGHGLIWCSSCRPQWTVECWIGVHNVQLQREVLFESQKPVFELCTAAGARVAHRVTLPQWPPQTVCKRTRPAKSLAVLAEAYDAAGADLS
jgi:hypothetical protein